MAVVVAEAAAGTGVGGAVVASEGAALGVDEDGRALGGEPVVVAVGGVVATSYLGRVTMHLVDLLQEVDIGSRLTAVGIHHHQAVVAATEEVYVYQQLHLAERYQRILGKIMRADQSRLLAAEEKEDIGVMPTLQVGHTDYVHHSRGAAGIVVGAIEDGVATHAQMLIVGGEDNHGVCLARYVSTDVLRAIAGLDNRRLRARLLESEVLVVVLAERLDAVGHQLTTQVVGGDGVSPILHPAPVHLLAAEVADDAAHIGAVLGGG